MTVENSLRLFFALWPAPQVSKALSRQANLLRGSLRYGRVLRRAALHVTLAFIGEVPRKRLPLIQAVGQNQQTGAFALILDEIRFYPKHRICWMQPSQPPVALMALARGLRADLLTAGIEQETRPFRPHVSLLRNIHADAAITAPPVTTVTPVRWQADAFVLVASLLLRDGAQYEILSRWSLPPSAPQEPLCR